MDLNSTVCLITGGTGGIGSATALALALRGADLAINSLHHRSEGCALMERIQRMGHRCILVPCDVSTRCGAQRCVEETVAKLGTIDVLVHCAGGPASGGLLDVDEDVWYKAFDIHLHAIFHLCRTAVPFMVTKKQGAIILISSAAGSRGCAGAIAYGVVKGAIPQFARAMARELSPFNIRVNSVAPGIIRTRFQDYLTEGQVQNNIENRIPLRREGRPEDVAEVIAMLASNDFITGENIAIDGGMAMRMV